MAATNNLRPGEAERRIANGIAQIDGLVVGCAPAAAAAILDGLRDHVELRLAEARAPAAERPLALRRISDGVIFTYSEPLAAMRVHDARGRGRGAAVFEEVWQLPPEHLARIAAAKQRDAAQRAHSVVFAIENATSPEALAKVLVAHGVKIVLDPRRPMPELVLMALQACRDQCELVTQILDGAESTCGGPDVAA